MPYLSQGDLYDPLAGMGINTSELLITDSNDSYSDNLGLPEGPSFGVLDQGNSVTEEFISNRTSDFWPGFGVYDYESGLINPSADLAPNSTVTATSLLSPTPDSSSTDSVSNWLSNLLEPQPDYPINPVADLHGEGPAIAGQTSIVGAPTAVASVNVIPRVSPATPAPVAAKPTGIMGILAALGTAIGLYTAVSSQQHQQEIQKEQVAQQGQIIQAQIQRGGTTTSTPIYSTPAAQAAALANQQYATDTAFASLKAKAITTLATLGQLVPSYASQLQLVAVEISNGEIASPSQAQSLVMTAASQTTQIASADVQNVLVVIQQLATQTPLAQVPLWAWAVGGGLLLYLWWSSEQGTGGSTQLPPINIPRTRRPRGIA
jgi:hypothetical protein